MGAVSQKAKRDYMTEPDGEQNDGYQRIQEEKRKH